MDVDRVVELRVHGVSGTPPEDLLDRELVRRVAGDAVAGFYRPRLNSELRDVPIGSPDSTPGAALEGYAWGGLTSGSPARALWLVLLPFTLVNLAPRLRPPASTSSRRLVSVLWYLSRVQAVGLTLTMTLASCGVGMDLLGWQCGQRVGGIGGIGGVGGIGGRPPTWSCTEASPAWLLGPVIHQSSGIRLLLGAMLPLLVLAALSLLSGLSIGRYESVGNDPPDVTGDGVDPDLNSPWMWRGEYLVRRLRHLHLQAGSAAVLAAAGWAMTSTWRYLPLGVAALVLTSVLFLLGIRKVIHRAPEDGVTHLLYGQWAILVAAAIGTVIVLLTSSAAIPARIVTESSGLPGYASTVRWLFTLQLLVIVVIAMVVVLLKLPSVRVSPRAAAQELGTIVLSVIGVFLGAIFSSGIYLYAAGWLQTGSLHPSVRQITALSTTFAVPAAIRYASLGFVLSFAALVVMIIPVGVFIAWSAKRITPTQSLATRDAFTGDYPDRDIRAKRSITIMRTFTLARLPDTAGGVILILLGPGILITAALTATLLRRSFQGNSPSTRTIGDFLPATAVRQHPIFSSAALQGVGAYLIVGTLVGLVAVGLAAYRTPKTRRLVGIAWDLASFWPRACHPLAAPCYAERSVPELVERIEYHLDFAAPVATPYLAQEPQEPPDLYPKAALVLAGHSQGTVISAAALVRIAEEDKNRTEQLTPRIAFLSFGCVLRRLYSRFFPAYFGTEVLRGLSNSLAVEDGASNAPTTRWINLWRHSDPIGGAVASGAPRSAGDPGDRLRTCDQRLIDPLYAAIPPATDTPPTRGHSDFWAVVQFQDAVAKLASRLN